MPCEVAETPTSTSSETLAHLLSFKSCPALWLTWHLFVEQEGVCQVCLLQTEKPKPAVFVSFPYIMCRFDWSSSFLIMSVEPLCFEKPLKAHFVIPKATSVRKNAFFPSSLKKLTLADVWLEYNTGYYYSFFTSVSSKANPDEFPHLTWTGSKIWGSAATESPGCTVCSQYTHIWLISLFGLLRCGRASHSIEGRFWKPGHGDDTAAGGAARVSTGTAELRAFREAELRGEERCEEPNMPRHMKGLVDHSLWGDWMQRRRPLAGQNKDGLDCERDPPPRVGERWTGN